MNYREKRPGSGKSESQLGARVASALRASGAMTFKIHGHLMQAGGWPDTYVAHPQWRGWIEFKVDKNNLDPRQRSIGASLVKRGDRFVVARFVNENKTMQIEDTDENILSVLGFSMLDDGSAIFKALRKASEL